MEHSYNEADIRANEQATLQAISRSILLDFDTVLPDLRLLGQNPHLRRFIRLGDETSREQLQEDFVSLAQYKRIYAQVRFLDENGMEKVRVDFDGQQVLLIPKSELQEKKHRYYFQDAVRLGPGQVYVSPLDLNIEHKEIERPFNPMIRFSAPVHDSQGRLRGVLVLNYLAERLLQHFDHVAAGAKGHVSLVNADGFWLRSENKAQEWGFMFQHGQRIQQRYPQFWEQAHQQPSGQFHTPEGLFTSAKIQPLQALSAASSEIQRGVDQTARDYHWFALTLVTPEMLRVRLFQHLGGPSAMLWFLGLVIAGLLSWHRAQINAEKNRLENDNALHAAIYETSSEGIAILQEEKDQEPTIVGINNSFCLITGCSLDEARGQSLSGLPALQTDPAFRDLWYRIEKEGFWEGEIPIKPKDGPDIMALARLSQIIHPSSPNRHFVILLSDITEKKRAEEALRQRAYQDPLTGLHNRFYFNEQLKIELGRARRNETDFALLYIDLNHFKPVNDNHGHHVGDHVLCEIADRLKSCLREIDTLARVGGDEFLALLSNIQYPEDTDLITSRIIQMVQTPILYEGTALHVTASIGLAVYPINGSDAQELTQYADQVMYEAKRAQFRRTSL